MRAFRLALLAGIAIIAASIPQRTEAIASQDEERCLALNIYFEARGASQVDKEAVGHVTVNRAKSRYFASTICGVVYQRGQFSWTTDRNSDVPREPQAWESAQQLAEEILSGDAADPSRNATYFYDHRRVRPAWASRFEVTLRTRGHTYLRRT